MPESVFTVLFKCSLILIITKINVYAKDEWVGPKSVSPCQNAPLPVIHHQKSTTLLLPLIVAANMWHLIWAINREGKSLIGKQVTKLRTPEVLCSLCCYKPDWLVNSRLCFRLATERQMYSRSLQQHTWWDLTVCLLPTCPSWPSLKSQAGLETNAQQSEFEHINSFGLLLFEPLYSDMSISTINASL